MMTISRYNYYKANEDSIFLKDRALFRKYYGETGNVKYYQNLMSKQLFNKVLRSLHGEFGKHTGIAKTVNGYGGKYYFPRMVQLIREWVISSQQCIGELELAIASPAPTAKSQRAHYCARRRHAN